MVWIRLLTPEGMLHGSLYRLHKSWLHAARTFFTHVIKDKSKDD